MAGTTSGRDSPARQHDGVSVPATADGPVPHVPIGLVTPDGQHLQVRLFERQQIELDSGCRVWRYKIAAPMWQAAADGGVEAVGFTTWVTADVLRPYRCVAYNTIPSHRVPTLPPEPETWGWVLRPVLGQRGRAVVHESNCRHAERAGAELQTEEALNALMLSGVDACHDCDAAAVLIPALQLGEGHG
ncbi:DUF6233 domain-containing protein [Streptomyces sp. NPDC090741]|uniref:DUF6233 domain-containing protein n=1 Tax=Streptomyces sp. NPDC090741 TaxID=3365967 RepID=UPI0038111E62